ncbi:MAG TPA: PhzF family phenazine biosynthesis protein [Micromonosporaceae bacterium]|jgi:trans-2,3-dihydro-3-hydroxyanthranilate isomerase|nr:PhzF family phenazine biosynthesis protein [Micromonosporaceae bacterium]
MKRLRYEIVDVFTDHPYAGNPLAVVLDAEGLDGAQMQSITREFNLSETAFVLPPSPGADYRIRIFTPGEELPFAGHPSVGTAVTLARLGVIGPGGRVQECGAGMLPVSVSDSRAALTGGSAAVGAELDPAPLLAAVGLTSSDFAGPAPRVAGCGINFYYLSVRSDALARTLPDAAALRVLGQQGLSVFAWDPTDRIAHTRVFCDAVGVSEDPATGSAALGFGVWLVAAGLATQDGTTGYTVRQGVEIRRSSTLECEVAASGGRVTRTEVAGGVVPVASGEIRVPPFVG